LSKKYPIYPALFKKEAFEKCSILFKFKEDEDFNRRHTFEYFEDQNLSLTQKLGKRGRFSKVSEDHK